MMIAFLEQFMITGFDPGDYTYGFVHIGSITVMLASIPILILYYRRREPNILYRHAKILAAITLFFYILRRGVEVYEGKPFFEAFWPFYLCNVNTVFLSIFLIFDIKKGRDFFMITGMSGAVLTFVVPDGVFNDRFMTLQIFESLLSHYMIFSIPMIFMATKNHVLDLRTSWQSILGLLLVIINVEVLQPLLTGKHIDYLFFRGPIEITFFGIKQAYVMIAFALFYTYTVYVLDYLYLGKIKFQNGIQLLHE